MKHQPPSTTRNSSVGLRPIHSSLVTLIVALLVLLGNTSEASFSISLPNGEETCFGIRVPEKSVISGSYDCLDDDVDGSLIKATVKDESSNQVKWTSKKDQSEGIFRLDVEPARYSLCFQSGISGDDEENTREATDVGFSLRWIPPPRSLPEGEEGPEAQRALQLMDSASLIDQDWQNMLDHYDFLRTREANHRELIEAIFTRLWKWTLIEAVLVISMAALQVMYLRKFFEQRRYL